MDEANEISGADAGGGPHRFPCPSCGADLTFAPGARQLACAFCGTRVAVAAPPARHAIAERDFAAALDAGVDDEGAEDLAAIACTNCGATVTLGEGIRADRCPFCDTPFAAPPDTGRRIRPAAILPFAITEKAARAALGEWLGSRWFAPSGLAAFARRGRAMRGIYIPFWTFDADTESRYRGARGTIYHVTRQVPVRTADGKTVMRSRQVQKIRWTPARGRVRRLFDDVLVAASRIIGDAEAEAIAPYDLSALEPYTPEYLAGFQAEAYAVGLEEGFEAARAKMARQIERDVRFAIGGDRQRIDEIDTTIRDVTFKHVLLPVWVASYRFRGNSYRVVINGQTGRVTGSRPWSAVKIALAVLAALAVAAAIGYFAARQG